MSFTAIVGGLFAFAKAVPAIKDIFFLVNKELIRWELSKITDKYTERQKLVDSLTKSISRAQSREERRDLSKILARYTSGKY
jgi:hypothetical protein